MLKKSFDDFKNKKFGSANVSLDTFLWFMARKFGNNSPSDILNILNSFEEEDNEVEKQQQPQTLSAADDGGNEVNLGVEEHPEPDEAWDENDSSANTSGSISGSVCHDEGRQDEMTGDVTGASHSSGSDRGLLDKTANGTTDDHGDSDDLSRLLPVVRPGPAVMWDESAKAVRHLRLDLSDLEVEVLRSVVRQLHAQNRHAPTVTQVLHKFRAMVPRLQGETEESVLVAMFAVPDIRYQQRMAGQGRYRVMERASVARTRDHFVRVMCNHRAMRKTPVVFVACTWMEPDGQGNVDHHAGQHSLRSAHFDTPAGPRGRLILYAAASVSSGLLNPTIHGHSMLPTERLPHDELREMFHAWFESLCRQLPESSVIVVDDSSHHWQRTSGGSYALLECAKRHGHQVARLPERHCSYNPLQVAWTEFKKKMLAFPFRKFSDMWNQACKCVVELCQPFDLWTVRVDDAWQLYDNDLKELDTFVRNSDDSDSN